MKTGDGEGRFMEWFNIINLHLEFGLWSYLRAIFPLLHFSRWFIPSRQMWLHPPDQRYWERMPIKEEFRYMKVMAHMLLQWKTHSALSEKERECGFPMQAQHLVLEREFQAAEEIQCLSVPLGPMAVSLFDHSGHCSEGHLSRDENEWASVTSQCSKAPLI